MSDIKAAIESLYKAYNVNPEEFTPERLAQSATTWKQNVLLNDLNLDCLHLSFDRKAFTAGSQFVIACSWQRDEVEQNPEFHNRKIVIIDPSISFGREHQTTLLMIELIEKHWQGRQLLDIGTGSGILAIIAQKLLPESRVEAFDISSDIVEYAHLMLKLNGLEKSLDLKQATVTDYPTEAYDLVTANLLADILVSLSSDLIARIKPGGKLLISGFMDKPSGPISAYFDWNPVTSSARSADEVAEHFTNHLKLLERIERKGWVAMAFQK